MIMPLPTQLNISPVFNIANIYTYHSSDEGKVQLSELKMSSYEKEEGNDAKILVTATGVLNIFLTYFHIVICL